MQIRGVKYNTHIINKIWYTLVAWQPKWNCSCLAKGVTDKMVSYWLLNDLRHHVDVRPTHGTTPSLRLLFLHVVTTAWQHVDDWIFTTVCQCKRPALFTAGGSVVHVWWLCLCVVRAAAFERMCDRPYHAQAQLFHPCRAAEACSCRIRSQTVLQHSPVSKSLAAFAKGLNYQKGFVGAGCHLFLLIRHSSWWWTVMLRLILFYQIKERGKKQLNAFTLSLLWLSSGECHSCLNTAANPLRLHPREHVTEVNPDNNVWKLRAPSCVRHTKAWLQGGDSRT